MASGHFGELRAPTSGTRLAPVRWTLPSRVDSGAELDFSFTIETSWARADDVSIRAYSDDPALHWVRREASAGSIPAGERRESGALRLRVGRPGLASDWANERATYTTLFFTVEITAAGGYAQRIPLSLIARQAK